MRLANASRSEGANGSRIIQTSFWKRAEACPRSPQCARWAAKAADLHHHDDALCTQPIPLGMPDVGTRYSRVDVYAFLDSHDYVRPVRPPARCGGRRVVPRT